MKVTISRPDQNRLAITSDDYGTMLVFQQMTKRDHAQVKEVLSKYFKSTPLDLRWDWAMASVFIFDTDGGDFGKKQLNDIKGRVTGKRLYATVRNGRIQKGNTLRDLQVSVTEREICVRQKFTTLLTYKLEGANDAPVEAETAAQAVSSS